MAETPEPNEKLVKVFDTDVESEAMVVQGSAPVGRLLGRSSATAKRRKIFCPAWAA